MNSPKHATVYVAVSERSRREVSAQAQHNGTESEVQVEEVWVRDSEVMGHNIPRATALGASAVLGEHDESQ